MSMYVVYAAIAVLLIGALVGWNANRFRPLETRHFNVTYVRGNSRRRRLGPGMIVRALDWFFCKNETTAAGLRPQVGSLARPFDYLRTADLERYLVRPVSGYTNVNPAKVCQKARREAPEDIAA